MIPGGYLMLNKHYEKGRFIIYYKDGKTKMEDRDDPHSWRDIPKYEYVCTKCGISYPEFKEVPMDFCIACGKQGNESPLVRQTMISAIGVIFDPIPLQEEITIDDKKKEMIPILSKEPPYNQLRITFPPYIFKGSSVWNRGWIVEYLVTQQFIGGNKKFVHGIRVSQVLNPDGLVSCKVFYLNKEIPATYSYITTLSSLKIDEPAQQLHSLKLSECGKRIVSKDGKPIKQQININLGERFEN